MLLLKTLFEAFLTRCVGKRDVLGHPRRKLISGFVLAVLILFALADMTVSKVYPNLRSDMQGRPVHIIGLERWIGNRG